MIIQRKDSYMKYRLMLFITAIVWGGGFVAQRLGAESIGPFTFNAFRFLIGTCVLLPFILWTNQNKKQIDKLPQKLSLYKASIILSIILFCGAALQQIGLSYTSAGKAGFITSLYIITVPILGLCVKHPLRISHLIGCPIAVIGLYLLAFHGGSSTSINYGDLLQLIGVFFWSIHILLVGYFVRYFSGLHLAIGQFLCCSLINMVAIWFHGEIITLPTLIVAAPALFYSGVLASGVGFTLQMLGQKGVSPTEASLICSLEMIFGAMGGVLYLGEWMSLLEWFGCILMTIGIFSAQIPSRSIIQWK